MRGALLQRQLVLLGAAALAVVAALAVGAIRHPPRIELPARVGSYSALAGRSGRSPRGCGIAVGPATQGIENPVLPCGERLYVAYHGQTVLASVIAHEPTPAGEEFGLTPALTGRLGLLGVVRVQWSYAGAGS